MAKVPKSFAFKRTALKYIKSGRSKTLGVRSSLPGTKAAFAATQAAKAATKAAIKTKMGTGYFGNKRYYPMGLIKSMPKNLARKFNKYNMLTLKAPPKANLDAAQRKNLRKGI
jgi:hypothetical protein